MTTTHHTSDEIIMTNPQSLAVFENFRIRRHYDEKADGALVMSRTKSKKDNDEFLNLTLSKTP